MPIEKILDRLNRWADNLPATEQIPISQNEKFTLAAFEADFMRTGNQANNAAIILRALDNGNFTFRGHRVIVLREGGN